MNYDDEQNVRIRALEERVNTFENTLSGIVAQLKTLTSLGKVIAVMAGAALGVDILPIVGA